MYAVLDIETTGGQYNEEGITEIAIYKYDGDQVVDQFISLVNPEIEIQPFVVKLTGINNAMLRSAPKFYEVAKRIIEMTENCVIVAHNAEFDYRILRMEFRRLGFDFKRDTLCTVELSKKLLPEQTAYSLGKLVRALGIPISDRHRANGDALATLKLFSLLQSKDKEKTILRSMIKSDIKTGLIPKFLDIVENLPSTVGIYYIHNKEGAIIYIGKSNNIKKKIHQHFTSDTRTFKKIQNETYTVTFEKTATELIAQLKENEEININTPVYNKISRKGIFPYSLYLKTNSKGYLYLSVDKTDGRKRNLMAFVSPNEGLKFIEKIKTDDTFNFYVDGFYPLKSKKINNENFFESIETPYEAYNQTLLALLEPFDIDSTNIMILDKGRTVNERSAVFLEKGNLKGYCFYDLNHQINDPKRIEGNCTPISFFRNNRSIILNYINKRKGFKLVKY